MVRYGCDMKRSCNYCWERVEKATVVVAIERVSGPPFVRRACDPCMKARSLKPVQ